MPPPIAPASCPLFPGYLGWHGCFGYLSQPSSRADPNLSAKGLVMARSMLVLLSGLLAISLVGCQGRNGGGVHLYGNTRVPPPPTHSYTKPQTYYSGSSSASSSQPATAGSATQPARFSAPPGGGAVGSGVAPLKSPQSGIRLKGMRVNDATTLSRPAAGGMPSSQPRATKLPAPGLQFIRRTSAEEELPSGASIADSTTSSATSGSGPATSGASGGSTWQTR